MNCSNPLLAARLYKPLIGKSIVKILPRRVETGYSELVDKYGRDNLFFLPCGHCSACVARKKKEWTVRCCMESMEHSENCFITLTYDVEHYPGVMKKEDLVCFIKDLRNRGIKCRYFGCGERGDQNGRCHFHIIIFGWIPKDLKFHSKSQSSVDLYTSKFVSDVWAKGLITVQEFSPFAASYVAGYCLKKMMDHDDSFHIQSTRPGIGATYFFKNVESIYDTDNLVLNFGNHVFSVPRYFDKLADSLDLDLSDVKVARMNKSLALTYAAINQSGAKNPEDAFYHQGLAQDREWKYRKRRI